MDVKNQEECPDETLKRVSSYNAGVTEYFRSRYVQIVLFSHVGIVEYPPPSLRKMVIAFCIYCHACSDPRNMRYNDVA